ncbi:MAG TPA: hypothetical protein VKB88_43120 [Bryobacteraceae bacterium]|nr:hypothetical protein [Bryobacteraceae bacterium]
MVIIAQTTRATQPATATSIKDPTISRTIRRADAIIVFKVAGSGLFGKPAGTAHSQSKTQNAIANYGPRQEAKRIPRSY